MLLDGVEISLLKVHSHFLKADILEFVDEILEDLPPFHLADVGQCYI